MHYIPLYLNKKSMLQAAEGKQKGNIISRMTFVTRTEVNIYRKQNRGEEKQFLKKSITVNSRRTTDIGYHEHVAALVFDFCAL